MEKEKFIYKKIMEFPSLLFFPPLTLIDVLPHNQFMKTLFLFLLLFTLSCNKDSSKNSETKLSESLTPTDDNTLPKPSFPEQLTWTDEFIDLVNDHRSSIGLRKLIPIEELNVIAQNHALNMASRKLAFGHDGFSERCAEGRNILGGGNWCGENVAMGQKTPQAAFTGWINSTGHKANIESSKSTHTGFGYSKNSSGTIYWVQIFFQH